MKLVFMGTPKFSVPVLEGLIEKYNVIGVVTQPDKLVGRNQTLTFSPVKEIAIKNNIAVLQPIKIRNEYQAILDLKPDIIVTCAYGQFIPDEILECPKYGCINVHASLLPKLRGGAPIHWSIINGDEYTGITIMDMLSKMDAGDIISQEKIKIEDKDNLESLENKLSALGKDLLLKTLPTIIDGTAKRITQNENDVTFAFNIKREDEKINFSKTKKEIFNLIRGLNPEPGSYALLDNKIIKIFNAYIGNDTKQELGSITNIYKDGIGIQTSDGEIVITDIQIEGKKRIFVKDYLNGIDKEQLKTKNFN